MDNTCYCNCYEDTYCQPYNTSQGIICAKGYNEDSGDIVDELEKYKPCFSPETMWSFQCC